MKVLKLGSIGPLVAQWQVFLRGQGFFSGEPGIFDAATEAATHDFQKRYKLDIDGKVGNQTFGKAAMLGFEIVDFAESEGVFPALPNFPPLGSNAARQQLFGPLAFAAAPTSSKPENLTITNSWKQDKLVTVAVPQLAGIKGAPNSGKLSFHRLGAQQLQGLWQAWADAGLLNRILSFDGAFNPRFVRGLAAQQVLSNHAFATAFDVNARFNPLGAEPALPGDPGCVYELVPLAHQFGFYWGGHFSRRDGMHFELAKLLP